MALRYVLKVISNEENEHLDEVEKMATFIKSSFDEDDLRRMVNIIQTKEYGTPLKRVISSSSDDEQDENTPKRPPNQATKWPPRPKKFKPDDEDEEEDCHKNLMTMVRRRRITMPNYLTSEDEDAEVTEDGYLLDDNFVVPNEDIERINEPNSSESSESESEAEASQSEEESSSEEEEEDLSDDEYEEEERMVITPYIRLIEGLKKTFPAFKDLTESEIIQQFIFDSSYTGDDETCVCGKKNIKYVTVMKHKENGILVDIGSECIKHWDADFLWLFGALKKGVYLKMVNDIPNYKIRRNKKKHAWKLQILPKNRKVVQKILDEYDQMRREFDIPLEIKEERGIKKIYLIILLDKKKRIFQRGAEELMQISTFSIGDVRVTGKYYFKLNKIKRVVNSAESRPRNNVYHFVRR